ncbi:MAG: copper oxidase [Gemmataceae bacterium]|nr:copper oxidase [Gemmataceae bacterium]
MNLQDHAGQGMNMPAGAPGSSGAASGAAGGRDDMAQARTVSSATGPQQFAVSFATLLALGAAVTYCVLSVNLNLGARDVGGAVMPPGMTATYDTPGQAMRDMAAIDPRHVRYTAPLDARGDQPLVPRLENGVKVFDLDASVIRWNILPDVQVSAYAFNRQVPGPRLRITEGDHVRINLANHLPEATSVHWHGLILPNAMDGAAEITQAPIQRGETYVYEFTARQHGTYFYHSHREPDRQQALGMYGALIIDPKDPGAKTDYDLEYTIQLQEWLHRRGYTFPAMMMEGTLPNYFTINGKAYPATETISMKVGQKLLVRFIGSHNNFIHPMHIHGGPFTVVATDGNVVPKAARIEKDTINVGPGERYDVIWTAREPGKWLLHCHMPHHVTNNNVEMNGAGGLAMLIEVAP